jgi:RsiW-degrading membrane proteinase PrsW (M82 family)
MYALLWLLLPLIVGVVVNRYMLRRLPDDPLEQIQIYEDTNLREKAFPLLKNLLDEKPMDLDIHYRYLTNYCEVYRNSGESKSGKENIHERYESLADNTETSGIGNYGLGYLQSCQKNYQEALVYYSQVRNTEQKYLNNSMGYAYKILGDEEKAETYFQNEIALNGNLEGAVYNLVGLYKKQGETQKLRILIEDEKTKIYAGTDAKSYVALRSGQIITYLGIVYIQPFKYINGLAAVYALMVCGIWFIYLWRINPFTREPLSLAFLVLVSGAFMALTCFILYDLWFFISPISPGESMVNDFIYFIFHVGIIEESVKFLPVVCIILILGERVSDPIDLVMYGGLSALGFATLENSLYFSVLGVRIINARFVVSTALHMAETMLLCYLWARARYMKYQYEYITILVGFCLVVLSHGLFDFFLTTRSPAFILLAVGQIAILGYLSGRILLSCILFSPRSAVILTSLTNKRLNNYHYLFSSAAVLMIISFLHTNYQYATEIANYWLVLAVMITIFFSGLILFPLANLGFPPPPLTNQFVKKKSYHPVKPAVSCLKHTVYITEYDSNKDEAP